VIDKNIQIIKKLLSHFLPNVDFEVYYKEDANIKYHIKLLLFDLIILYNPATFVPFLRSPSKKTEIEIWRLYENLNGFIPHLIKNTEFYTFYDNKWLPRFGSERNMFF
jgi:hypothetical protein